MSKEELYYSCNLSQGTGRDVAYLPERAARQGNSVEIVPGSGDFWTVTEVADRGLTRQELQGIQAAAHKGFASTQG